LLLADRRANADSPGNRLVAVNHDQAGSMRACTANEYER
jgi:hypothetical protein